MSSWPPSYQIRKHRLTKNVKLIASKRKGLIISVPARFSTKQIPSLLEENKTWIIAQFSKINTDPISVLPDAIHFLAANEIWRISHQTCKTKLQLIARPCQELVLIGKAPEGAGGKALVAKWTRAYAAHYLQTQLTLLSRETRLSFKKLTVRDQHSCWGSCSGHCAISLNYKLIFLPFALMRHILIHELCHTVYMNHSPDFWQLVAKHDPDYLNHKKSMRVADRYLPSWIY